MNKSKVFIFIAISFALGILLASAFSFPRVFVYISLAFLAALFALFFYIKNLRAAYYVLFLFCACLGALRLQLKQMPNEYKNLFNEKRQMEGYVVEEPAVKTDQQTITFRPNGFSQNILITNRLTQDFAYGDYLAVDGKITEVQNFGDFDYAKYLERFNTYATMRSPKILILKSGQLNPVKLILLKAKAGFIARLGQMLKEPQNSLAVGILIGGHGNLPQNIVDNFNNTGVSHIIAVSGFNITIIISFVAALAYVIGRRSTFWFGLFIIAGFIIITGASASVVRAGVMGFLLLFAQRLGRQYSVGPALFFAGLLMLAINPKILFWDVGFQLSFAATLGIIYFMPVFERLAANFPKAFGAKSLILTTAAAILATLPLILYNFGTFSTYALIVNALILPAVPFAMFFGFLSAAPFLGPGFALLANALLVYILKVTAVFAALPYSSIAFQIPLWFFWFLAACVFWLYFVLFRLAFAKQRSSMLI